MTSINLNSPIFSNISNVKSSAEIGGSNMDAPSQGFFNQFNQAVQGQASSSESDLSIGDQNSTDNLLTPLEKPEVDLTVENSEAGIHQPLFMASSPFKLTGFRLLEGQGDMDPKSNIQKQSASDLDLTEIQNLMSPQTINATVLSAEGNSESLENAGDTMGIVHTSMVDDVSLNLELSHTTQADETTWIIDNPHIMDDPMATLGVMIPSQPLMNAPGTQNVLGNEINPEEFLTGSSSLNWVDQKSQPLILGVQDSGDINTDGLVKTALNLGLNPSQRWGLGEMNNSMTNYETAQFKLALEAQPLIDLNSEPMINESSSATGVSVNSSTFRAATEVNASSNSFIFANHLQANHKLTEALAERLGWLQSQKIQMAEVQLDPPELGPLQIKIHVQNDQTSVTFVTANPIARELLEQQMPRLKEMLQDQGMALVDAGVSDHSNSKQSNPSSSNGDDEDRDKAPADPSMAAMNTQSLELLSMGVDAFV